MKIAEDPVTDFIKAAAVPLDGSHRSGTIELADAILTLHPDVARSSIYASAVLGDDATVRRFIDADPACATTRGGPYDWDALTYLCFSKYLRLSPSTRGGFVRAAAAMIDAGANPNTGFFSKDQPPVFESVIYGAAGIAHHPELTRLLLQSGANPNDGETEYHAPEDTENTAVRVLVESGKLTEDSLTTMLLRKADWHDHEGLSYLLEHGADPNRMTQWGFTALHQAVRRDNSLSSVEVLLNQGADPHLGNRRDGKSSIGIAAHRGRGDLLAMFARRGVSLDLQGVDRLIAACAMDDAAGIRSMVQGKPELVAGLLVQGGDLLAEFSGVGNTAGVRHLLDLGVAITALYENGDVYFGIARNSMALHVAAWRASHATVKLLIERGAPVNARDGEGRAPLELAVKACVDSYWTNRRSRESVQWLLDAGASSRRIAYPSGYDEVDELLRQYGAGS